VKIFGLRLPFTPGIFPKERYTLSRSIGRMVSRELITEDALRRQVRSQKTKEQLSASVSNVTESFFSSTLSGLSESLSGLISGSFEQIARDAIRRFLSSRDMIHAVRDIVTRAVSTLSGNRARGLMDGWGISAFVSDRLLPLLAEPGSLIVSLSDFLVPMLDPAVDRLMDWLRTDDMRGELERRGRKLVSDVLDKLNLLQRFFLTAGQFGRRLDEKMPEIVEDALESLESLVRDPGNQKRLIDVLAGSLRDWRDAGGGSGAGMGISRLLDSLLSGLERPETRRALADALQRFILEGGDPTVGRVLSRLLGLREDEIAERRSFPVRIPQS
jgi:hypothetical protein